MPTRWLYVQQFTKFALGLLLTLYLTVSLHAQTGIQANLPQGEARQLVATICTQCHSLRTVQLWRSGMAGWKREVDEMVLRGARITPKEVTVASRYLAQFFGPDSRPLGADNRAENRPQNDAATQGSAVSLPVGPGKEIVETQCARCHDLNRVVVQRKSHADWEQVTNDMMINRGAQISSDQIQVIVTYLSTYLGK